MDNSKAAAADAHALFVSVVIAIHLKQPDIVDYHGSRLTLANKFDSEKKPILAFYYSCFACKGIQNKFNKRTYPQTSYNMCFFGYQLVFCCAFFSLELN